MPGAKKSRKRKGNTQFLKKFASEYLGDTSISGSDKNLKVEDLNVISESIEDPKWNLYIKNKYFLWDLVFFIYSIQYI